MSLHIVFVSLLKCVNYWNGMVPFDDIYCTDRHRCFKSSNIPKTEVHQIHLSFVTVLRSP